VARGVLADGRIDTDRQRETERDDQREQAELEGHREALQELRRHRRALPDRTAKIALERGADPAEVLDEHRPVKAQGRLELRPVPLGGGEGGTAGSTPRARTDRPALVVFYRGRECRPCSARAP